MKLEKGKWYFVTWVDAVESVEGSPSDAHAAFRQNPLKFEGYRTFRHEVKLGGPAKVSAKVAVFAKMNDHDKSGEDNTDDTGWWTIPSTLIKHVWEVKE